jgi:hypothetical protein
MSTRQKRRWWIPALMNPTATRKSLTIDAVLGALGGSIIWRFTGWPARALVVIVPIGGAVAALVDWQMD